MFPCPICRRPTTADFGDLDGRLVEHGVLCAGLKGGRSGPGVEQGIEFGVELLAVSVAVLESGQLAGQAGGESGGFLQVAHHAGTGHVGQAGHAGGVEAVGELAVEGIVGEFERDRGALAEAGDGGGEYLGIAARQGLGGFLGGKVDAGDGGLGQALQLGGLADAVLVQVAPEAEVAVLGIGAVEKLVAVAVDALEGVEGIDGVDRAAGERFGADDGIDAEQLTTGVDGAVAIAVEDDEGIVGLEPAGAGLDGVGVVVEENPRINSDCFDAVTVQIDGQGIAAEEVAGKEVEVVEVAWQRIVIPVIDFHLPLQLGWIYRVLPHRSVTDYSERILDKLYAVVVEKTILSRMLIHPPRIVIYFLVLLGSNLYRPGSPVPPMSLIR